MSDYMRNRKTLSTVADAYREMHATPNEDILNEELIDSLIEDVRDEEIEDIAEYLDEDENLDESKGLAAKAKKSGISVGTLRKVYNRGMAAWKTGHRPGTTPQQWGMARVNAFIVKKKKGNLNHDKDLAHVIHPDDSMLDIVEDLQEEVRSVLGEAPYDKADVKKVKGLEKKLRNMLKEVDKVMRGSGLSAPAFSMVRSGITKGLQAIEKFYKIADKDSRKKVMKNPRGYVVAESLNEVTDKEINMAKKLSKDMEKVKKGYQQIAKSGDKTLKNTGFNPTYEAILKAQQKVLSLIGELNTMKMMSDRAASRQKDSKGRPIMNSFDAYRDMQNAEHCELVEGKVLKFTNVKDRTLEKHLKTVTKKVGAKLEKISGGFAVSDTDMKGFTAVVDYIFDKSIKKNMLDGGGMSDVNMVSEDPVQKAREKQRLSDTHRREKEALAKKHARMPNK